MIIGEETRFWISVGGLVVMFVGLMLRGRAQPATILAGALIILVAGVAAETSA